VQSGLVGSHFENRRDDFDREFDITVEPLEDVLRVEVVSLGPNEQYKGGFMEVSERDTELLPGLFLFVQELLEPEMQAQLV
jgi:hypothetical protein